MSRDTVYRQFGSKSGLLEAVFDEGAARGGLDQIRTAFTQSSALEDSVDLLHALTSFQTYHQLSVGRQQADVASLLTRSSHVLLGVERNV